MSPAQDPDGEELLDAMTQRYFIELPCAGPPPDDGQTWVRGEAGSQRVGTQVLFHVVLDATTDSVVDARVQVFGCPHVLAVCTWIASRLPGRRLADALAERPRDWADAFRVPIWKLGRLLIVEDALRDVDARAGAPFGA